MSHAKNKKQNTDPNPCIDPTPKSRSHLQPQKILWNGLLCHCPPCLTDHWEMRKDKMQSESTCFKNYRNGQKKKGSKKLTSPWQNGRKRCVSHFLSYEGREGGKITQIQTCNLFLCFLNRKIPLCWSFGWGRSVIEGCATGSGAVVSSAIVDSTILGGGMVGCAMVSVAIPGGAIETSTIRGSTRLHHLLACHHRQRHHR